MKHRDFTRTFHVRSYTGRRLRNPFFGNNEPSRVAKWCALAGAVLAPVGIAAVLVYAPFLQYRDVRVEGLTTLSPEAVAGIANTAIAKPRLFVLPGRNIFLADEARIVTALHEQFHFATLEYRREGRTLLLSARERISEVAWIAGERTMLIDLQGIAVRDASDEERAMMDARMQGAVEVPAAPGLQPTMPIIVDLGGEDVTLGATVIEPEKVTSILAIDGAARERSLLPLRYTIEEATTPWVTLQTSQFDLYFDFNVAVEQAFVMFDAYRGERADLSTLLYIDLRFGNHVYIKEK